MPENKEYMAGNLKVKIFNSREALGKEAAIEAAVAIKRVLEQKKEVNIIFAAAPSQNEFLSALIADVEIPWGSINAFHMDEYINLDYEAPQGFGNFLRQRLFEKVDFKSVHYLDGNAEDIEAECRRYSRLLQEYPTDIVCMGIGENGHIAFNDPHVANFDDKYLVKVASLDLKCRTQQVNDGCFASLDEVPVNAVTLTIPALTAADCIFCMVPGRTKADAVYGTVLGEVTENCPASILQRHKNAILYIDKESGSRVVDFM
ncbi:Glucosamine-6-phosphate deaminase [Ruminiclostridium papyrosolvens DSM 2782]|uniref:Glucosamine-6-phosphate deaminase n=1 Tax=Ruminiclostridium papyrosolvens DSM 2782 TaxID=588581 RepID=F1TF79_9FIRM|nr:glucosamine-6-phosphate deaminase [Ruminiclostridium papyrosolvens]EGD47017.1 Glucosamine-6-phosphate deaminase [Ruminiclostridium papyrosolvens DSM 2782]WES33734.1 glucosamine-6-phosphate deaminase [Ruminiclostridium papyrosolvens DSM 2782]